MKIGRVIGNIWATRKDENLSGLKLLVVQPLNLLNDQPIDTPIVAADIIGAGVGEKIENMFREMIEGPGAVRDTIHKYVAA